MARILLLLCIFLSGFSGLVYEILWTRSLTRVIGGSPYAVSIILTAFMASLGLGGLVGGRVADRLGSPRRLLLGYAAAEACVGLFAALLPAFLDLLKPAYAAAYAAAYAKAGGTPLAYHSLAFLLTSLALLPPVACMGATLPLLGRLRVRDPKHAGGALGFLYGLNTLGAAAGVALAGFWMLPAMGLRMATLAASLVNLGVAAACALLARARAAEAPASLPEAPAGTGEAGASGTAGFRAAGAGTAESGAAAAGAGTAGSWTAPSGAVLGAFFASGFCAMAYEVIWTKVLGLVLGPTAYAFTWVLMSFILGLATGGWAFARLADAIRRPVLALALAQGGAALLALIAGHRIGNSLTLFGKIDFLYRDRFAQGMLLKGLFALAFTLPATILLGAAFPLAMRVLAGAGRRLGRSIGGGYAANTLGGVAGSWCAGFLLVPMLGSELSLRALAGIQLALALALGCLAWKREARGVGARPALRAAWTAGRAWKARAALAGGVLLAGWACLALPRWDRAALSRASGRILGPEFEGISWSDAFWNRLPAPASPLPEAMEYYGDGIGGFTAVWSAEDVLGRRDYSLFVSGKADASTRNDMFTQVLLAHVPLQLHPRPRKVMVLGLASGVTAGEALGYPVDSVDVLEINPQVVRADSFFRPWNGNALADPRVRLILQDAKAHLLLTDRTYDVIVAEPSNPWMAGLAELYSREFFLRARDRLADGGLLVQFLHSYAMDWEVFSMVGRTFASVFPEGILVRTMPDDRKGSGNGNDYLLVGRKGGAPPPFAAGSGREGALAAGRNLRLADPRLLSRLVEAEDLPALFGTGAIHTDDRPLLEYAAPMVRFAREGRSIEAAIASRARLRAATRSLADSLRNDAAARIAFDDFALSLYRPFPDTLGPAPASILEAYAANVENYCADHQITDLGFLKDPGLRTRCAVAQMAMLNRRLKAGIAPAAPLYLAMGEVCLQAGGLPNALRFLEQAIESGGPGTPVGLRARARLAEAKLALSAAAGE